MESVLTNENGDIRGSFCVIDDEGRYVILHTLFIFDSSETGKSYIVYTDDSVDENGSTNVYASTYDLEETNPVLRAIETEREWKVIEIVLEELQEGLKDD